MPMRSTVVNRDGRCFNHAIQYRGCCDYALFDAVKNKREIATNGTSDISGRMGYLHGIDLCNRVGDFLSRNKDQRKRNEVMKDRIIFGLISVAFAIMVIAGIWSLFHG